MAPACCSLAEATASKIAVALSDKDPVAFSNSLRYVLPDGTTIRGLVHSKYQRIDFHAPVGTQALSAIHNFESELDTLKKRCTVTVTGSSDKDLADTLRMMLAQLIPLKEKEGSADVLAYAFWSVIFRAKNVSDSFINGLNGQDSLLDSDLKSVEVAVGELNKAMEPFRSLQAPAPGHAHTIQNIPRECAPDMKVVTSEVAIAADNATLGASGEWLSAEFPIKLYDGAPDTIALIDTGAATCNIPRSVVNQVLPHVKIKTLAQPQDFRTSNGNNCSKEYVELEILIPAKLDGKVIDAKLAKRMFYILENGSSILVGIAGMGEERIVPDIVARKGRIGSCQDAEFDIIVKPNQEAQRRNLRHALLHLLV